MNMKIKILSWNLTHYTIIVHIIVTFTYRDVFILWTIWVGVSNKVIFTTEEIYELSWRLDNFWSGEGTKL